MWSRTPNVAKRDIGPYLEASYRIATRVALLSRQELERRRRKARKQYRLASGRSSNRSQFSRNSMTSANAAQAAGRCVYSKTRLTCASVCLQLPCLFQLRSSCAAALLGCGGWLPQSRAARVLNTRCYCRCCWRSCRWRPRCPAKSDGDVLSLYCAPQQRRRLPRCLC